MHVLHTCTCTTGIDYTTVSNASNKEATGLVNINREVELQV